MHWIKTLRENLKLNQNALAAYLHVSVHTIQSVEQCRRALPFPSMGAAITLYNAVKDGQAQPVHGLTPETDARTQRKLKGLYRRCRHKLVLCTENLQKMQEDYNQARQSLRAYQRLTDTLSTANTPDNLARRQWTQWRIQETRQRIKDNNTIAQGLLTAEMAALEGRIHVLEKMFATEITGPKNQSDAGYYPATSCNQGQQLNAVARGVKGNTTTPQHTLPEPLKSVLPATTQQKDDTNRIAEALTNVDHVTPTPGAPNNEVAPGTRFKKDSFEAVPHEHTNNDTGTAYNEEDGALPHATPGSLAKTVRTHNRTDHKKQLTRAQHRHPILLQYRYNSIGQRAREAPAPCKSIRRTRIGESRPPPRPPQPRDTSTRSCRSG